MKHLDPLLPIGGDAERLRAGIEDMERRRIELPTLVVSDGATEYGVYDYLEIVGGVLATVGSNGLRLTLTPYYAICRLTTAMATITTEAKVTPLATSLSGFTVSSDILTCSNAGKYRLDMSCLFSAGTAGDVISVGYRINGGTTIFPVQDTPVDVNAHMEFTSVYLDLAASDTVEFRVKRVGAGNATLYAGSGLTLVQIA